MPRSNGDIALWAVLAVLIARFLAHTWKGLLAYFSQDDMMNLYQAWTTPIGKLVWANLTPFTDLYRPLGQILYRIGFAAFDLNPVAFRSFAYMGMLINIVLLVHLARKLSGSLAVGAFAGLLGSYHHRMIELYTNNGTFYDVLCYGLMLGLLLYYMDARGSRPGVRQVSIFYFMFVAALNSKELAITLPAMLLAYEALYFPPARPSLRSWFQWLFVNKVLIWISVALALGSAVSKMSGKSPFLNNPAYSLEFTWSRFSEVFSSYTSELFHQHAGVITILPAILIYSHAVLLAALFKRRELWFALALIVITPLPLFFILHRGFFVMYLPVAGWALFGAVLLNLFASWIARVLSRPRLNCAIAVFLLCVAGLYAVHTLTRDRSFAEGFAEHSEIYRFRKQTMDLYPALPKGSRLLFLDDPFTTDNWQPLFILTLSYNDPSLVVDRVKMLPVRLTREEIDRYDRVVGYENGRLFESRRKKQ